MSQTKINSDIKVVTPEQMLEISGDKKPLVELRDMSVSFGYGKAEFKAVNNMNINIFEGEVLGLVGESGSGKSTTGNAIAGIVDHKGTIKVSDIVVPNVASKIKGDVKKQMVSTIQMIFQDPAASLNPFKNVEKVVSEGLANTDSKRLLMKSFDNKTIAALLKMLPSGNLKDELTSFGKKELAENLENKQYETIKEILYTKPIEILSQTANKEATTFLEARLFEREKYFEGKTSKKHIARKMVIETLKSVGLSERVLSRYPLEFSGGQQQRIGISRAIILNPKLLIADEPIAALDVSIQAQVINILNELRESLNLTILFIAHDLRMVEYISDRIAVMYKGVIVEIGETSEIARNPIHPYTKMLMDAVPSIDRKKGSLIGYMYNPNIHDYSVNKPEWVQIKNKNHFVLGHLNEVDDWVNKRWANYVEAAEDFVEIAEQEPEQEVTVEEKPIEVQEVKNIAEEKSSENN